MLSQESKIKISIITPAFNSASTIEDTLRSVAEQTYPHVEHIIVDGASGDGTLEVVGRFPHVSQVVSEKDKGIYDAMNKGVGLATGEVVGILNSDDFYTHRDVLEKVMKSFRYQEVDALYGDLDYVDHHKTDKIVRQWKAGAYSPEQFRAGWMPPHPAFFVRKSVYDKLGLYRLDMGSSADYEFMLRVLYKYQVPCTYLPETLVHMRTGGQSNASLRHRWKANQMDARAWQVNGLQPHWYTRWMKPLRKISQWVRV
jgi:glycosyltransferase